MMLGVVLLVLALPTQAQIDSQMETMFRDLGSMANVSNPNALLSARGGVVTGGSLQVKNKVVQFPQLVSYSPGRIKGSGGCGGIDLVFGSLSFVSKEQLIEYAKSLASNAATYAFDLGLRGMCPMCQAEMEKLQGFTNKLNLNMKDSCERAQELVAKTGLKDWAERREADWNAAQNTGKSDPYAGQNQGQGQKAPIAELAQSNPQLAKLIVQGNIVWRAMKKTSLGSRISNGNDELLQDLMSFVGTRVVCIPGDPEGCEPQGSDPSREGTLVTTNVAPSLSFKDLLVGSRAGSPVTVLRCSGSTSETGCLKLTRLDRTDMKGFAQRVRERFLGSTTDVTASDGLVGRWLHGGGSDPSAEDQAYMLAFGGYGANAMRLAMRSEAAGREFADRFADAVAARYLYAYISQLLDGLATAISESRVDSVGSLGPLVRDAMDRLSKESAEVGLDPNLEVHMQEYVEYRERAMGPPRLPTLPAPKSF